MAPHVVTGEVLSSVLRPMRPEDAPAVGSLHYEGIPTGFLSSLGPKFLTELYAAVPNCPSGFGFVADLGGGTVAFVACATSTGALYKEALKKRGARLALKMLPRIWRPSTIRNSLETLLYPSDVAEQEVPDAEVLSIVVGEEIRRRGLGKALIQRALAAFRGRGIEQAKVAVWTGNEPAQALYRSCGFRQALVRDHHGEPMAIYVADTGVKVPEVVEVPVRPRRAVVQG